MIEDHEILTINGWKKIPDIAMDDILATYNIYTDEMEWNSPLKIKKTPYAGDVLCIKNNQIDIVCAATHRVLTRDDGSHDLTYAHFSLKEAASTMLRSIYKKDAENSRPDIATFDLPSVCNPALKRNMDYTTLILNMDLWLEFLGIYLAYGATAEISPFIKFDIGKIEIINKLLKIQPILGVFLEYSEANKVYFIHSTRLYEYLKQFGDLKNRTFPQWALNLSENQSTILLNALISNSSFFELKHNANFQTYSKDMADAVQILSFNAGYCSDICIGYNSSGSRYVRVNNGAEIYCNVIYSSIMHNEPIVHSEHQSISHYDGNIYNIDIANDVVLTRRNNKYCWIG